MMLSSLALILLPFLPQGGEPKAWVDREMDPARPEARVVHGMPELNAKDAWDSAMQRFRDRSTERFRSFGEQRLAGWAPIWLPSFLRQRALQQWVAGIDPIQSAAVLDRDLLVRDHGFGKSYQAFLLVREPSLQGLDQGLRPVLGRVQRGFLWACGGVVGLWSMLLLGVFWLDRLTRGYMTTRLSVLGLGAGIAGPALLLLL